MIFTLKEAYNIEIVKKKLPKFMVVMLGQTTPKFSPEIGSKLPHIYITRYTHDFYCESRL